MASKFGGNIAPEAHLAAQSNLEVAIEQLREKYANEAKQKEEAKKKPKKPKKKTVFIRSREDRLEEEREGEDDDEDFDEEDEAGLIAEGLEDEEDPELEMLRQMRLNQIKSQQKERLENLGKGHGQYREIAEDEFLKEVTGSKNVVVHFYSGDFERCKIMDMHLRQIANAHVEAKFVKIQAEKAPFFVSKLNIRVLPTVVCFVDGIAKDRVVGFEELGGRDEFPTSRLEQALGRSACINVELFERPDDEQENDPRKKSIYSASRKGYGSDSD